MCSFVSQISLFHKETQMIKIQSSLFGEALPTCIFPFTQPFCGFIREAISLSLGAIILDMACCITMISIPTPHSTQGPTKRVGVFELWWPFRGFTLAIDGILCSATASEL